MKSTKRMDLGLINPASPSYNARLCQQVMRIAKNANPQAQWSTPEQFISYHLASRERMQQLNRYLQHVLQRRKIARARYKLLDAEAARLENAYYIDKILQTIGAREVKLLGQGAMGTVFWLRTHKPRFVVNGQPTDTAAIKIMNKMGARSEDEIQRFYREIDILKRLRHPNIIPIFQNGILRDKSGTRSLPFYVMEAVQGHNLEAEIQQLCQHWSPDDPRFLKRVTYGCIGLTDGVRAMVAQRIVHRDLKPENVLVKIIKRRLYYMISDFGMSKGETDTTITLGGMMLGTPYYMPPEQVTGQQFNFKSDIYALGKIFYYIFSGGDVIYKGLQPMQIIVQLGPANQDAGTRKAIEQNIKFKALRQLLLKMTAFNPEERPDAREVLSELRTFFKSI